ncbi:MAG TPA: hypothetical protein VFY10_11580 [Dehalococcoidia bacterium]|nr:hypothetical protein [Dehalococcoidia bacterium]
MSDNGLVGRRNVAIFDERRNSSRVWPVTPDDVDNYQRATARLRREHPNLVAWIEAGAPPIHTDADHRRWFGEPYNGHAKKPQQEQLA